ncbi:unnamed protein product, partial [Choristocarpus tenellus]
MEDVVMAVKACMPRPEGHTIFMQQDWAKPYTKVGIMEAIKEVAGGDIVIETQPVNSLDLHINELRLFYSIQQLEEDVGVTNTEELVEVFRELFNVYPWETLERVWQSLFAVYGEVLGSKGNNVFNIPYLSKEKTDKVGKLPRMPGECGEIPRWNGVLEGFGVES